MLLLEDATGIKLKHISYDGTRQRMTALLAKTIEIGEINLAAATKYIQNGDLKGLGITTKKRNPEAPDVQTTVEQGINLVYGTDRGIVLPKGTPADVVDHYAKLLEGAMNDPAIKESLAKKGTQSFFVPAAPYRAYFEKTFAHWEKIAKKVGVYKRKD